MAWLRSKKKKKAQASHSAMSSRDSKKVTFSASNDQNISHSNADENSQHHFNETTWMSLFGLLDFIEVILPVSQTVLWQQHVAWSRRGKDIRDYSTQRFSSNMVFLSLLLNATLGCFMNSARFATDIRDALMDQSYWDYKYWLAVVLMVETCITVIALVANFVAWSLISSLSDSNAHALLRSSIGQYVTYLPSRYTVLSLYLFLLWLLLLIPHFVRGPFGFVLLAFVLFLFLQVIVSLSAFGRLIIHTGAMGSRRVLHPDLETQLMPSGLHAALLIEATERRQRQTQATDQYKKKAGAVSSTTSTGSETKTSYQSIQSTGFTDCPPTAMAGSNNSKTASNSVPATPAQNNAPPPSSAISDRRVSTGSSGSVDSLAKELQFPSLSVLNQPVGGQNLQAIVRMALERNEARKSVELDSMASSIARDIENPAVGSPDENNNIDSPSERRRRRRSLFDSSRSFGQQHRGAVVHKRLDSFLRSRSLERIRREAMIEADVREMYGVEPPAVPPPLDVSATTETDPELGEWLNPLRSLDFPSSELDPLFVREVDDKNKVDIV